ncbi:MAG: hypothetical protein GKR91_12030 [Pseudomonadales bacterium]|nr:hypothetical protein [Pseudomonadales bacterium]
MSLDEEYRIVPETCLTLTDSPKSQSDFPQGQGVIFGPEEVEKDILEHTRAGPFASLDQARAEATTMLEENPDYSLMIVKGLVSVEHLWNQDYWFNQQAEDTKKQTSKLFVIGLAITAALLLWFTSPVWALSTLILCIGLSVLFWEPHLATQVFAPVIIAILSSVLYSFLQ